MTYTPPTWATFAAAAFVILTLVLSLYLLFEHLSAYKNPEVLLFHEDASLSCNFSDFLSISITIPGYHFSGAKVFDWCYPNGTNLWCRISKFLTEGFLMTWQILGDKFLTYILSIPYWVLVIQTSLKLKLYDWNSKFQYPTQLFVLPWILDIIITLFQNRVHRGMRYWLEQLKNVILRMHSIYLQSRTVKIWDLVNSRF